MRSGAFFVCGGVDLRGLGLLPFNPVGVVYRQRVKTRCK